MSEGFYWIHVRGSVCGVEAEGNSDSGGDSEGQHKGGGGNNSRHTPEPGNEERYGGAQDYAENASGECQEDGFGEELDDDIAPSGSQCACMAWHSM